LKDKEFNAFVAYLYGKTSSEILNDFLDNNPKVAQNSVAFKFEPKKYDYFVDSLNLIELCNTNSLEAPPEELIQYAQEIFDFDVQKSGWILTDSSIYICKHDHLYPGGKEDIQLPPEEIKLKNTIFENTYLNYCSKCFMIFFKCNLEQPLKKIEEKSDDNSNFIEGDNNNLTFEKIENELDIEKEIKKEINKNYTVIVYEIKKRYKYQFNNINESISKKEIIENMKKMIQQKEIVGQKCKYYQFIIKEHILDENTES
jgi:hypothetical protein